MTTEVISTRAAAKLFRDAGLIVLTRAPKPQEHHDAWIISDAGTVVVINASNFGGWPSGTPMDDYTRRANEKAQSLKTLLEQIGVTSRFYSPGQLLLGNYQPKN